MTTKPTSKSNKSSKNQSAMPEKITAQSEQAQSANLIANNIEQLKALFPEAWAEGKIDFDVLRQLLGDKVEEREEKFGLNWHGKRGARQLALQPSMGTLRPSKDDSVDWDTTKNLMIEGDNLEVLKLLQRSYAGKVKLIYIDPPYNTGNDFVYPDDFRDNIKNYLELTGQVEGGRKLSTNGETSGRFHTDWLNMMYPRLKLAKDLLATNGIVFVSVDDAECAHLRAVMNEIFGEENFIACFVWKSRQNKDNRTLNGASVDHEYVLAYGESIRGATRDLSQYDNPDNDPRGSWTSANMVGIATRDRRPNLHFDLIHPVTQINYGCPEMGWRYEPSTMARLINENRIIWPITSDGRPRRKAFFNELDSDFTGFSTLIGAAVYTRNGTAELDQLFEQRVFQFPKPVALLRLLIEQGSSDGDTVSDFFAGSGSTADAVMRQSMADGKLRNFVCVQIPKPLSFTNPEEKTAAIFCEKIAKPTNLSELTKERLRRAAKKIKEENPTYAGDLGFRVFKLDSSNINTWDPVADDLEKSLYSAIANLKDDRTEEELLFEVLLKLGLELTVPIETKKVGKLKLQSVGQGALIACLAPKLAEALIEDIGQAIVAWHQALAPQVDSTVILRDSAFPNDVTKANLTAILQQYEPASGHKIVVKSL